MKHEQRGCFAEPVLRNEALAMTPRICPMNYGTNCESAHF
jgi:hypothetical protein